MMLTLNPGELSLTDCRLLMDASTQLSLHPDCLPPIHAAQQVVEEVIRSDKIVYGINTGFGALANTRIDKADLERLQRSIVLSHAAGTGTLLDDHIVRLILALKINSLARGFSGVRLKTIEALIHLYNAKVYPCIPCQGSVGAWGDLAPLAHLSAVLIGEGEAKFHGDILPAKEVLAKINLAPLTLAPKEGLALLNGTQASTALALAGLFAAENVFYSALIAGALSVDAACGSSTPFDDRIQQVRGHLAQIKVAAILRDLLKGSDILASHQTCQKVQDPYSLRCQPQVMGACLAQLEMNAHTLLVEANSVSDNPLVFADQGAILSGGNFHAEPVALAADALAVSIAEIGAMS